MGSYMALDFCQKFSYLLNKKGATQLRGLVLSGSGYSAPTLSRFAGLIALIERLRLGKDKPSPVFRTFCPQVTLIVNLSLSRISQRTGFQATMPDMVDAYIDAPWCRWCHQYPIMVGFFRGVLVDIFGQRQLSLTAQNPTYLPLFRRLGPEWEMLGRQSKP